MPRPRKVNDSVVRRLTAAPDDQSRTALIARAGGDDPRPSQGGASARQLIWARVDGRCNRIVRKTI